MIETDVPGGRIVATDRGSCEALLLHPSLGRHLIRRMAQLGMIIEADHMSVKARNETLDELETLRYPGVISSHSWSASREKPARMMPMA